MFFVPLFGISTWCLSNLNVFYFVTYCNRLVSVVGGSNKLWTRQHDSWQHHHGGITILTNRQNDSWRHNHGGVMTHTTAKSILTFIT